MTKEKSGEDAAYSWDVTSPDKTISQHFETKTVNEPIVVKLTYEEYKILYPKTLIVKLIADNHGCRTELEKEIPISMETAQPCLEQMFGVFATASDLILGRKALEKRTDDKDILEFNDKVNELYENLLKQKENFAPTYNLVKNISKLIETLSKLKASNNIEKEYLDNLFLVLFTLFFGVIKCTDCKTLQKTEIQALMPHFNDEFGKSIREMISRFRENKDNVNQIEASIEDFLAHRVCPSMDGFFEELKAWVKEQ
jgi:hypothetical protein